MIPALVNSLLLSRGKSTSIVPGANNFVQPFQPFHRRPKLTSAGAFLNGERTVFSPFFATWDPATVINVSVSNGSLSATHTTNTAAGVRATSFKSTGKFYWEITNSVAIGSSDGIGFQTSSGLVNNVNDVTNVIVFLGTVTELYANNNAAGLNFGTKTLNDRWGIAVDFDAHLCWFRRNNGSWNTSGPANPATGVGGVAFTAGSYTPFVSFQNATSGEVMTANFGATAFTDTVPSGFTAGWPS